MRKKLLGIIILSLILFLSGCNSNNLQNLRKENEELKNKVQVLEDKINSKENMKTFEGSIINEKPKLVSITYCDYKYKQRFVSGEIKLYVYPQKGAAFLRNIPKNTIVKVINAGMVESENRKLWLYVNIPVHDSPMDNFGWVPEEYTQPLTKQNQKQVQSDVTVKKGTEVYEVYEFEMIKSSKPIKLNNNANGRLEEKKNGLVRLSCAGGWGFWVNEKYIIYPSIN